MISNADNNPLRRWRRGASAQALEGNGSGNGGGGNGIVGGPTAAGLAGLPPKPPPPAHGNGGLPGYGAKRPGERGGGGAGEEEWSSGTRKRRRSNEDVLAVAGHYNSRPNFDRVVRQESPIIGLKNFNNWVKSVLIAKFGRREGERERPRLKVLDLGCGKGGDLQKWSRAGTEEYVGVDLAAVSIEQARSRWEGMRSPKFNADFYTMDCFSSELETILTPAQTSRPFDVVSLQFCMHYAFESEEKVRTMLHNVSRFLKPGGYFMGTIPDSYNLLDRLADLPHDTDPSNLSFGNEVYRVQFDSRDQTPRYGHRYTFFLQDAVEEVPEYVVYWEEFVALAGEYGLRLEFHADFQRIFAEEQKDPHFADLLRRMKVLDRNGETEMTVDQWEAANLYVGFAFVQDWDAPPRAENGGYEQQPEPHWPSAAGGLPY